MPPRHRPTARDYRNIFDLLGSLNELSRAGKPDEARLLLLERTTRLLGGAAAFWTVLDGDQKTTSAPDPTGAVRTDVFGLDDWQLALWEKPFFDEGEYAENPLWEPMQRERGRLRTRRRAEVVTEASWSRHPQHEFARALGFDDDLASLVPIGEGRECMFVMSTAAGDRRFGERERLLVHLLHGALPWFYRGLVEPLFDGGGRTRLEGLRARLAPRLRPVLDQLLTGRSEKAIAAALQLAPRTVHKYVEHVFVAARVSSRAELMALFIPPRG